MSSGIAGRCDCPLGRHHAPDCPNYIDVWRSCPCPECVTRRIVAQHKVIEYVENARPARLPPDAFTLDNIARRGGAA